jgi:hypothetical protein
MSNRFSPKFAPIRFDPSGVFSPETGLSRDDQVALFPQLEAARAAVLIEIQGGKLPLLTLPERMLEEYGRRRHESELGRILAAAKQIRDAVDRVIIIGDESATLGARALFDACCHPYHNEQGRGDRGGRPRINFISPYEDNDALHGLIDLLETERPAKTIDRRWGIVAIDTLRQPAAQNLALESLLSCLHFTCTDDLAEINQPLGFITHNDGWLARQSSESSGAPRFLITEGVGQGGEILTAVGLFPAAIMGIDVVRLLEGAAAMTDCFRSAPLGNNPPLDLVGVKTLTYSDFMRVQFRSNDRGLMRLSTWCSSNSFLRSKYQERVTGWRTRKPRPSFKFGRSRPPIKFLEVDVGSESLRRDWVLPVRLTDQPHPREISGWQRRSDLIVVATLDLSSPDEAAIGQWIQMSSLAGETDARLKS